MSNNYVTRAQNHCSRYFILLKYIIISLKRQQWADQFYRDCALKGTLIRKHLKQFQLYPHLFMSMIRG